MATGVFLSMPHKPHMGGSEEHAHQLTKHLIELGERIVVLAPYWPGHDSDVKEFDSLCGYPVIRFDSKEGSGEWRSLDDLTKRIIFKDILKAIRSTRADYFISNFSGVVSIFSVLFATKLTGIPHFTFVHHLNPRSPWRARKARGLNYKTSNRVICVSKDTAEDVIKHGADPQKVRVVNNGVDVEGIGRHLPESTPNGNVLLTVSRLVEYKGIQRVIEAMPRILAKVPDARYVIVGDGDYRGHLISLAKASPARDAITFTGAVTDSEKFDYYNSCDVFVMPSEEEGFGIVFLEANAFGKPVIGGDVMGVPEAIVDGVTGFLVDPHDVDAIANRVIHLLKDPDEARRLGENGRRRVELEFSWRASAQKFLDIVHLELRGA